MGELRACIEVPADPGAPTMARRVVVATTVGWGMASLSAEAELVVSELVTNALLHAPGTDRFVLTVVERPGGVRVEVADGSSIAPVIRELEDGRAGSVVAGSGQVERGDRDVLVIEAGIDVLCRGEASKQQPGRDHQHHAHGDLQADERAAQTGA